MPKNDGGPAYPVLNFELGQELSGMSKREVFAGQAMQGMLAGDYHADGTVPGIVNHAVGLADALIAALEARDDN